ncbi:MAG: hypothetical protein WKF93_04735 [Acidimicrobiales bacterium]
MAASIVDCLQVVDVDERQAEGLARPVRPNHLTSELQTSGSTEVRTREPVERCVLAILRRDVPVLQRRVSIVLGLAALAGSFAPIRQGDAAIVFGLRAVRSAGVAIDHGAGPLVGAGLTVLQRLPPIPGSLPAGSGTTIEI